MRRKKKEIERSYIRECLELMGYQVRRLIMREKPDAQAIVHKDGRNMQIGIELTRYHVDAPPGTCGGSPGSCLDSFWREVQRSLERRVTRMKRPPTVDALTFLKPDARPRPADARLFAAELLRLMIASSPKRGETKWIESFSPQCGLLRKYASKVRFTDAYPLVLLHWHCANTSAAMIGVSMDCITKHVEEKASKAKRYDWGNADERWLIICASGRPIVSGGGARPDQLDWRNDELTRACAASGFGRIFFFELVRRWCQPVWPYGPPSVGGRASSAARRRGR